MSMGKHSRPLSGQDEPQAMFDGAAGDDDFFDDMEDGVDPYEPDQMAFAPSAGAASGYSRASGANARYTDERSRKTRRRTVTIVLVAVLAVLLVGAGLAFAYVSSLVSRVDSNLQAGADIPALEPVLAEQPEEPADPFYVLLLGTDQSIQRDIDQSTEGTYRTDTIILARVDPGTKKVTMVSIPRDTQVDLGEYGTHKINAAYAFGGPALAVQTVSQLSGVGISHFVLIDMDGLVGIIDALGGIEVDVPMEINDWDYTGHLDAGWQTLNGEQALIFARSRHAYDEVGDGDLIRTATQRQIISAIVNKVLQQPPLSIVDIVTGFSEYVTTDMNVADIADLATKFVGMDTGQDIYSGIMPVEEAYVDGVWVAYVDTVAWNVMMERVKAGLPPTSETEVDAGSGVVMSSVGDGGADVRADAAGTDAAPAVSTNARCVVKNGSYAGGVAGAVASTLQESGVQVVEVGDADSSDYGDSLIIYNDDAFAAQAQAVALQVPGAVVMRNDGSYALTGDILVVVGNAYADQQGASDDYDGYDDEDW